MQIKLLNRSDLRYIIFSGMANFSLRKLKFKIVKDKRNKSKKYEEKYSVLFLSHGQIKRIMFCQIEVKRKLL